MKEAPRYGWKGDCEDFHLNSRLRFMASPLLASALFFAVRSSPTMYCGLRVRVKLGIDHARFEEAEVVEVEKGSGAPDYL